MNGKASRTYTSEEVNRIIRRALKDQDGSDISHEELLETAREMGVDSGRIEAAIVKELSEKGRKEAREAWLRRQKAGFHRHLWSYIIVNGALLLINLLTSGPWWFQWPLLGWGIGLAFHYRGAYFPGEDQIAAGARKIQALEQGRVAGDSGLAE